jgi:hypothetical protein
LHISNKNFSKKNSEITVRNFGPGPIDLGQEGTWPLSRNLKETGSGNLLIIKGYPQLTFVTALVECRCTHSLEGIIFGKPKSCFIPIRFLFWPDRWHLATIDHFLATFFFSTLSLPCNSSTTLFTANVMFALNKKTVAMHNS